MDFNKFKNSDNFYSLVLFFIGWGIIVLGIIGSIVLGNTYTNYYGDFNFAIFLIGVISTVMSGFLILGLGEIISLLNDNRRLLAAIAQNAENTDKESTDVTLSPKPRVANISKTPITRHKVCPSCGYENGSSSVFCDKCGYRL